MTGRFVTVLAVLGFACFAQAADEVSTSFTYFDPTATSVALAGEFSNWDQLPMTKDESGNWTRNVLLKPGTYGYKFVVNGTDWMFDSKNTARKIVGDVENSAVTVGGTPTMSAKASVVFNYSNSTAKTVHLVGEFNNWLDAVEGKVSGKNEWLMQSDNAGNWKYTTQLSPGRYKFKYAIDGGDRWEQDPKAPASDDGNSIIEVKSDGGQQTTGSVSFRYTDPNAKTVSLAGEFNQWSTTANLMTKNESGVWTTSIALKPGRYPYKFVVDGSWKQDPDNSETAPDGLGGSNSVKAVTQ